MRIRFVSGVVLGVGLSLAAACGPVDPAEGNDNNNNDPDPLLCGNGAIDEGEDCRNFL